MQHWCMACQRVQVGSALFQGASQAVAAAHAADAQHLVVVKGKGNSVCRRSNGGEPELKVMFGEGASWREATATSGWNLGCGIATYSPLPCSTASAVVCTRCRRL